VSRGYRDWHNGAMIEALDENIRGQQQDNHDHDSACEVDKADPFSLGAKLYA
jgi:hypothetical protein